MTVSIMVNKQCPKCGSIMIDRKIWKSSKSTEIMQCSVCKYYIITSNPKIDAK